MTDSKLEPRLGRGSFQWNGGGWLGSVGGGLAWLIPSSFVLFTHRQWVAGGIALLATSVSVTLGVYLWRQRQTRDPYAAMMIMLGSFAITNTLAWLGIGLLATPEVLDKMHWPASRIGSTIGVFVFVVAFMIWFYFLEHSGRRARAGHGKESP